MIRSALGLIGVLLISSPLVARVAYPWERPEPKHPYNLLFCPLVTMSGHCGNQKCEIFLGENERSCPMDCARSLVQTWNAGVQCDSVSASFAPRSIDEIPGLIDYAREHGLKVRTVGRRFSNTDVICSEDISISSENLTRIYGIENFEGHETVLVESGASLGSTMEYLASHGKALLGFPSPIIRPATVGGALATSSHSSSPIHPAIMSDVVASVEIVNWRGETLVYSEGQSSTPAWQAATANVGLLGVMTRIRLKIRDEKSLRMEARIRPEADIFSVPDPIDLVEGCDYGQFWWNPIAKTILWVCGHETSAAPDLRADNILNDSIQKTLKTLSNGPGSVLAPTFELAGCSKEVRCALRDLATRTVVTDPKIFSVSDKNGQTKASSSATGQSYRMMTGDFDGFNKIRTRFLEVVVPGGERRAALEAIRTYFKKSNECEVYSIYNIRFVPILGHSLVGNTAVGEGFERGDVAMFIEINGFYPKGMDEEHFGTFDAYNDGLLKLLIEEHGARPHWGKGEHWYHQYAREKGTRRTGIEAFNRVLEEADPHGMFGNAFTRDAGFH